jgi:hypothetical protein
MGLFSLLRVATAHRALQSAVLRLILTPSLLRRIASPREDDDDDEEEEEAGDEAREEGGPGRAVRVLAAAGVDAQVAVAVCDASSDQGFLLVWALLLAALLSAEEPHTRRKLAQALGDLDECAPPLLSPPLCNPVLFLLLWENYICPTGAALPCFVGRAASAFRELKWRGLDPIDPRMLQGLASLRLWARHMTAPIVLDVQADHASHGGAAGASATGGGPGRWQAPPQRSRHGHHAFSAVGRQTGSGRCGSASVRGGVELAQGSF